MVGVVTVDVLEVSVVDEVDDEDEAVVSVSKMTPPRSTVPV